MDRNQTINNRAAMSCRCARRTRKMSMAERVIYNILKVLSSPAAKATVLGLLIIAAIGIMGGLEAGSVSMGTGIVSMLLISLGIFVI